MIESKAVKLEINDLFEEFREENNRLLIELKFSKDLIKLCKNYRNFLNDFFHKCKCDEEIRNGLQFNALETQYKSLFEDQTLKDINHEFSLRDRDQLEDKPKQTIKPKLKPKFRKYNKSFAKYKKVINIKTNETKDNFEDNSMTFDEMDSNEAKNKIKRNQRQDFIHPKPIFGDNLGNNEEYSDEELSYESFKDVKNVGKSQISGYLCQYPDCDYRNGSKGNVSRHISKMHLNKKPLICNECDLKFWGQKRLFDHKKAIHFGNLIYNMNRNKYKCDYNKCNYETKSLTNWTQHKRRHIGDKPFKCEFSDCLSAFVTNSELKTHRISIHSNELPFKCQWSGCEQAFKTKDRLKCHMFVHTDEYPYRCEWPGCDAKYAKNADLKLHQLCIHSDEYPFQCEWPGCEAKFKTKNGRRLHNFTHTGERPYKCEWPGCEASYYMISKLNRHKLTHNGIKRYVCSWPQCQMKYSTSHNLKLHLMVHRNERPFMCDFPQCQRRFTDKSQMKRHSKKVHKNVDQLS